MKVWTILLFALCSLTRLFGAQPSACSKIFVHCFALDVENPLSSVTPEPVTLPPAAIMQVRASHGGVLAHHWIELQTAKGAVTIGYGPASIPFIDAGQISVWNQDGSIERSGLHLLPTRFNYAKPPGAGKVMGNSLELTAAQADTVLRKESHRKLIFPYIPIFHDCRTFVCTVKATAAGKSTLPCYLLFKGYW